MQPLQLEPGRRRRPVGRLLVEGMREVDDPRGLQVDRLRESHFAESREGESGGQGQTRERRKQHFDLLTTAVLIERYVGASRADKPTDKPPRVG